jgi:hypothetical protein
MASIVDYSAPTTAAQIDMVLRQGPFDGVFHYLAGDNAFRIEDPTVVQGVRALGWPQLGISVPSLGGVNGAADAARARDVYGFGDGLFYALDIEPAEFAQNPTGWASAADGWCDAVRAAGLSPGVYGTDVTVAACANHADWIWRAIPGMCDPAGPGLDPTFFAGRRAVQCIVNTVVGGLEVDISQSEFSLGVNMATIDQVFDLVSRINKEVGFDDSGNITPGGVADVTLSGLRALSTSVSHLTDLVNGLSQSADSAKLDAIKAELDAVNSKIDAKFAGLKITETA